MTNITQIKPRPEADIIQHFIEGEGHKFRVPTPAEARRHAANVLKHKADMERIGTRWASWRNARPGLNDGEALADADGLDRNFETDPEVAQRQQEAIITGWTTTGRILTKVPAGPKANTPNPALPIQRGFCLECRQPLKLGARADAKFCGDRHKKAYQRKQKARAEAERAFGGADLEPSDRPMTPADVEAIVMRGIPVPRRNSQYVAPGRGRKFDHSYITAAPPMCVSCDENPAEHLTAMCSTCAGEGWAVAASSH